MTANIDERRALAESLSDVAMEGKITLEEQTLSASEEILAKQIPFSKFQLYIDVTLAIKGDFKVGDRMEISWVNTVSCACDYQFEYGSEYRVYALINDISGDIELWLCHVFEKLG